MATPVLNPEHLILKRTHKRVCELAAAREFVSSAGERVRSVGPKQVRVWVTTKGSKSNSNDGVVNIPLPAILISHVGSRSGVNAGTNCAEDEVHQFAIQICDSKPGPSSSYGPIRTYGDWMNRIRREVVNNLILFRQDFDPDIADPFSVRSKDRIPADPDRLMVHDQNMAMFSFTVAVRHSVSK